MIKKGELNVLVLLAVVTLGAFIVKSYIITLVLSAIAAYFLWPIHKKIRKKTNEIISATVLTCLSAIVMFLFLYYGINLIISESARFYILLSEMDIPNFSGQIQDVSQILTSRFINSLSNSVSALFHILLSTVIFFVSLFYFLKEGETIHKKTVELIPFKKEKQNKITKDIKKYLQGFVRVHFSIAIIQGIIATAGFMLLGLPYPLLAGFIAGSLSLLPSIGPEIMYIGAGAMSYHLYGMPVAAKIVAYGLIIGSILDYLVRPYFCGKQSQIHPLIVFLGIFGGLETIGISGIIVGPIILSISITLLKELRVTNG